MKSIFERLGQIPFQRVVCLFPIAVALHQAEEWDIIKWYERYYADTPPMTDASLHIWLVFATLLGVVWTGAGHLMDHCTFERAPPNGGHRSV